MMIRGTRRVSIALACLLLATALFGEARGVRVGVFPAAPLVMEGSPEPTGLFIDLLAHFSQEFGWKIEYRQGTWNEHLAALERGELDLLPAVGYTAARSGIYDFSRHPVYIDSGVLFTSPGAMPHSIFELQGKRVAGVRGSIFTEGFLEYTRSFGISCELVLTETNRQVMEAITAGTVDAGVCIYSLGSVLAREFHVAITPISFSPIALYFAAPKGRSKELLAAIDRSMGEMLEKPDSLYAKAFKKWINPEPAWRPPTWLWLSLAGIGGLGLWMAAWNIILKERVAQRTEHLRQEIVERSRAEESLKHALEEKDVLLRELYHRTKNTLQVIRSLVSLQAAEFPEDGPLQQVARSTEEKIQAIALVHQMLIASQDISHLSIREYVQELAASLMRGYEAEADRIILELEVPDRRLLFDSAIPLGLIINELMTNSLLHAFPGGRRGSIRIALSDTEGGGSLLRYSDDGIGLPADFKVREQSSLGLRLIHAIGEGQLLGKVRFESGPGLVCTVELPRESYVART